MYSFSDRRLAAALRAASQRGVKCRLILNKAKFYTAFANSLEKAGVDVRYVSPVMHHKFAIIDGPQKQGDDATKATLLTGSSNWTRSAFTRYDEDLLRMTEEPQFAVAFQREFNHLWRNAREFGKAIHPETVKLGPSEAQAWFTSANMEPYLYRKEPSFRTRAKLEGGVCGKRLIAVIDGAEKTVRAAATHFRREDLFDALKRALDRGVKVQLLLDGQEYHSKGTSIANARHDEALPKLGAEVRYKTYSRFWDYRTAKQMHCKYLIVDDKLVLTGSLNWSENSELKTMENLVGLDDAGVVGAYVERFKLKWDYGKGKLDALIASVKKAKGKGPCNFEPIALTAEEIVRLRKEYKPGACRTR